MGKKKRTVLTEEEVRARLAEAREKGIAPDFRDTEIRFCDFRREDFRSADFTGAKIVRTHFIDCDLRFSKFKKAKLRHVSFHDSDMRECLLLPNHAWHIDIGEVNLSGAAVDSEAMDIVYPSSYYVCVRQLFNNAALVATPDGWRVATGHRRLMPVDDWFSQEQQRVNNRGYGHDEIPYDLSRLYATEQYFRWAMGHPNNIVKLLNIRWKKKLAANTDNHGA